VSQSAPVASPPLLRRLPLPRWEPPYDDEVEAEAAAELPAPVTGGHGSARVGSGDRTTTAGVTVLALPLELPAPSRSMRLVPEPAPTTRSGGAPLVLGSDEADPDEQLPRTPSARLPEPRAWAGRLVQVLLEVLAGERPASQVMRHVSLAVYADLVAAPPRVAVGRARPASAATVVSVRVMEPDDGVAEVTAVTRRGRRHRALALRLEGQGGRWRCVALEVG
jgi:hypothetical protein